MRIIDIFFAFLFSFGAAGFSSFYFNTNKYDIIWGALLGAAGWLVYVLVRHYTGSEAAAYFCGAFTASFISEAAALIIKNPATVYLLPALLPLVPGGGMFLTMRAVVQGQMENALTTGFSTLTAAGAIALGIALASSLARIASLIVRYSSRGSKDPKPSKASNSSASTGCSKM